MIVLGVDPGLAHMGLALMDLQSGPGGVEARLSVASVIETKPANKKLGVRKSDDNMERARTIASALKTWASGAYLIIYEAQSFGMRGGVAARQAGTAFGIIAAVAESRMLPILCVQPTAIKVAVCGNRKASKEEVIAQVHRLHGGTWKDDLPARLHEHAADAIGAVTACLQDDLVRAMLAGVRDQDRAEIS